MTRPRLQAILTIALGLVSGCAVLPIPTGPVAGKWWNGDWHYRSTVIIPPEKYDRTDVTVSVPADLEKDLAALGLSGEVDPKSIRVFECDPGSGAPLDGSMPSLGLPTALEEGRLYWLMAGRTPAAKARAYQVYYDVAGKKPYAEPPRLDGAGAYGDYATDTYRDGWDFNEDDFDGIHGFGDKPECVPKKEVREGVLSMDIKGDGYFIWGKMWGDIGPSDKVERIDLDKYSLLEIRARQDVKSAMWELYGRVGASERLYTHKFWVGGGDWRTIRIDLRKDAGWRGKLTAFRIDPAQVETGAHVEIDWVRLVNRVLARREPTVAHGLASGVVSSLKIAECGTSPVAGSEECLTVAALDADGKPVSNVDVVARLIDPNGAELRPGKSKSVEISPTIRHGLTDKDGLLSLTLKAPTKAGAVMHVEAFQAAGGNPSTTVFVRAKAGKPVKYLVDPSKVIFRSDRQTTLTATAQLADEFGNPLQVSGVKVKWMPVEGMAFRQSESVTDGAGRGRVSIAFDPEARTVYTIQCEDEQGRKGESADIVFYSTRAKENPISMLPNGYFAYRDGKQYIPLGGFYLNYVYYGETFSQLKSFVDATEDEMKASLAYLAGQGVTGARFMLRAHRKNGMEPMDIVGRVNPTLYAKFQRYLDLAKPHGIKFLLVIHEDYTKPVYFNKKHLEQFALPHYEGMNMALLPKCAARFIRDDDLLDDIAKKYTDPDVIECQKRYMRELIPLLRNNEGVFAYELENEMVDCPASWANEMIVEIKRLDPVTPVCVSHGGGGLHTGDPLWWLKNTKIDFYTYHLYPHCNSTTPAIDYGMAVDILARYGRFCGPCFLGESVGDQFSSYPVADERRLFARDIIWFSLLNGNPGCFFWNMRDDETSEFALAKEIMSRIDLATFRRARPEIGVDVTHPLDDDKFFRTEEGKKVYAVMGQYVKESLDEGIDFDFTTAPGDYKVALSVAQNAPLRAPQHAFGVSRPYQLKCLAREGMGEALVYLRNIDSIKEWKEKRHGIQYLRQRARGALDFRFDLPCKSVAATMWDLDTGKSEQRSVSGAGKIELKDTDHDYVVLLRAQ